MGQKLSVPKRIEEKIVKFERTEDREKLIRWKEKNFHEKWNKEIEKELAGYRVGGGLTNEKCDLIRWSLLRTIEEEDMPDFSDAKNLAKQKIKDIFKKETGDQIKYVRL